MTEKNILDYRISRRSVLASIGAGVGGAAFNTTLAGGARAQAASTITYAIHLAPTALFFDPGITPGTGAPLLIQFALHDALMRPVKGKNIGLSLAESMDEAKDGLSYTFKLRKGVTFQDGSPLTAADAKFSFDRYKGANNDLIRQFVKQAEVLDDHTIRYVLTAPWPDFKTIFGTAASGISWVLPKAYIEKVGDEGFRQKPMGAGPYKIASFKPGTELVLEAYEGFWRKKPDVKRHVMRVIPDAVTRLAVILNGEVDIAYAIQGDLIKEAKQAPQLRIENAHIPVSNYVVFASMYDKASPWHDERVRRAANMAMDRKGINDAAYAGLGTVSTSIIPHVMEFYWPTPEIKFDVKAAKALLAEAGFPNGFDGGELHASSDDLLAEPIQANLAAVGIKVQLRPSERAALLKNVMSKNLKGLILTGSGSPGNASSRLQQFVASTGSLSYVHDAELDKMIKEQALDTDEARRKNQLDAIQKRIFDHSMFLPILEFPFPVVIGPRIGYSGVNGIPGNPYTAPYEDMTLKS